MSPTDHRIPPRLQEIVADFQMAEGREKLEMLLEYAESLPPLPEWLRAEAQSMDQVHECMTPVFVQARLEDGGMKFFFAVPAESPTVRGFAALLADGLQGATPDEVLAVPGDFYVEMGLQQVLTQQRLNGIAAILAHLKRLAVAALQ